MKTPILAILLAAAIALPCVAKPSVMENTFVRRFPVYKHGDTNASPTGGYRQFQYKLKPGEAAWQMKIDRVESY